jgi:catechol 2,3-dioxygenase-like lactoylglutathione lyase family enzyme
MGERLTMTLNYDRPESDADATDKISLLKTVVRRLQGRMKIAMRISSMNKLIASLSVTALIFASVGPLRAQQFVLPSEISMGRIHLLVSDIAANKQFWVAMGGTPSTLGSGNKAIEGVTFGSVHILLHHAEKIGPAAESTVNHIGFYVPDVKAAVARWKDMGLKIENGRNEQQSWIWSPDNLIRVEVLEMPGQTLPVAFHHVHMFVAANAAGGVAEAQAWYAKLFAGRPGKRAAFDIDTVTGAELTFSKSDKPTMPSAGSAVDHIGFWVKNLEAYCRKLKANGVQLEMPYTKQPDLGFWVAFITDPWGTRIELYEPLK